MRHWRWLLLVVLGALLLVGGAVLGMALAGSARESRSRDICLTNMHLLHMAFRMYASDHESSLPFADMWVDGLSKYIDDPAVFSCPTDRTGARSSYAMNVNLSGRDYTAIADRDSTVLLYHAGRPGDNPSGTAADVADAGHDWFLAPAGMVRARHIQGQPPPRW